MSKVFIEETTLTAIGDAIREKTGKTELIAPLSMATEISSITTGGGGSEDIEPIVLTGDCEYGCRGEIAAKYIELFGDTITTENITNARYMFSNNTSIKNIPFEINLSTATSLINTFKGCSTLESIKSINSNGITKVSFSSTFADDNYLKTVKLKNINITEFTGVFNDCHRLNNIIFENITFANITSGYLSYIFENCYSLREIPVELFECVNSSTSSFRNSLYYNAFKDCYVLDEIIGIPIVGAYTSNVFNSTVSGCGRLKNFIFANNSLTANWKNQVIILSASTGYTTSSGRMLDYNSGITADKEVKDDATYQALKDDPDWFTLKPEYSRYNKVSALNTINSLPDTSAYLATAGGTNTIQFTGEAGSKTDGGAINTLTEEEIAVATAKGWTVSFV